MADDKGSFPICIHCGKGVGEGIGEDCYAAEDTMHDFQDSRAPAVPAQEAPREECGKPHIEHGIFFVCHRLKGHDGVHEGRDKDGFGKTMLWQTDPCNCPECVSPPPAEPQAGAQVPSRDECVRAPEIPADLKVDWGTLSEAYVTPVTLEWAILRDKNMQSFARKLIARIAATESTLRVLREERDRAQDDATDLGRLLADANRALRAERESRKQAESALRDVLDIIADEPELEGDPTPEGMEILKLTPPLEVARMAVRATKECIFDKARMRALAISPEPAEPESGK